MLQLPWFVEKLADHDNEQYQAIKQVAEKAMLPQALDKKTMLLIVLALDASKGAGEGVRVLAAQARQAGANEQEIKEALRLAYYVSGMDTVKASLQAFAD